MTGMLRLMVKDVFMLQRRNFVIIPLFSLYLAILSMSQALGVFGVGAAMAAMAQMSILMVSQAAFGYDEQSKFDVFLNAMPVKKSRIVLSRYLTCVVSALMGALWVFVLMLLLWAVSAATGLFTVDFGISADALLLWLPMSAVVTALIVPLLFKFGYMKARYFFTLLIAGTAASIPMLISMTSDWSSGSLLELTSLSPALLFILSLLGGAVLLVLSYGISVAVYRKKQW